MRLQIESDIVMMGGTRKTAYLKLPKNLVELFELKAGKVTLEVTANNDDIGGKTTMVIG